MSMRYIGIWLVLARGMNILSGGWVRGGGVIGSDRRAMRGDSVIRELSASTVRLGAERKLRDYA